MQQVLLSTSRVVLTSLFVSDDWTAGVSPAAVAVTVAVVVTVVAVAPSNCDPNNPNVWCSLGVLYYQLHQNRDALDAYTRAIKLDPNLCEVRRRRRRRRERWDLFSGRHVHVPCCRWLSSPLIAVGTLSDVSLVVCIHRSQLVVQVVPKCLLNGIYFDFV